MTTIATDGVTIAADGLRMWGSERRGTDFQKIIMRHGRIYAFTGMAPMMDPMIGWHHEGANVDALPKMGTDAEWGCLIVIDRDGIAKYSHGCPYIERFDPPIAFGAGADYAMGAMLAGVGPRRAVEVAASLCYHTGGTIAEVDIAGALGLSQIKEAAE